MHKLRYLEQAKEDLLNIKRYIAHESGYVKTALDYTNKLRAQCRSLAEFNGTIGTKRPELGQGIRSFPHGNYVIFFRYKAPYLEVVTITEGHRDIGALFQSRP